MGEPGDSSDPYGALPPPPPPLPPGGYVPYAAVLAQNPFDRSARPTLVLGILGVSLCNVIAPVAWIVGAVVRRNAMRAGYGEPELNRLGRLLGMAGTLIGIGIAVVFGLLPLIGRG